MRAEVQGLFSRFGGMDHRVFLSADQLLGTDRAGSNSRYIPTQSLQSWFPRIEIKRRCLLSQSGLSRPTFVSYILYITFTTGQGGAFDLVDKTIGDTLLEVAWVLMLK